MELDLETRVTRIESFVWDFPTLLNGRFERLSAAVADFALRMDAVERALSLLQHDVRDMRGGVTAQLRGQDRRLDEMSGRIGALEQRMTALEQRVDQRLDTVDQRLDAVDQRLETVDQRLDAVHQRLSALERGQSETNRKLDVILARLS